MPGQLLIVEAGSSTMYELPPQGQVLVGRAPDAQVKVNDPLVSRHHARLDVKDGDVLLVDLGSHNGTRVNGERISTPRRLISGDTITLCDVCLLFSRPAGQSPRPIFETVEPLRIRLEEETERALHTRRPAGVLCLRGTFPLVEQRQQLAIRLGPLLRVEDVLAWEHGGSLLILRPDCDQEEALQLAQQLHEGVQSLTTLRIGVAACPSDGYDVDALLGGARAAAEQASEGQTLPAVRAMKILNVAGHRIVIADPVMTRLYSLLERLASGDIPVLVCGETGTGKELAAQALHAGSKRKNQRLQSINCAALAESLAESELFGHERGAFSGAVATKVGLFESASGGTVFLDEIGELPLALQAKLLRVLETKKVIRVGDTRERPVDFRIVAATNRRLPEEVAKGRFRQDLYFRLSSAVLTLPPLRERQRELAILAQTFLSEACQRAERPPLRLAPATLDALLRYQWPGNLRELRNVMDYAASVVTDPVVELQHLPEPLSTTLQEQWKSTEKQEELSFAQLARTIMRAPVANKLDAIEAALVTEALRIAEGNKSAAARILGVHRRVVERRIDKHTSPSE